MSCREWLHRCFGCVLPEVDGEEAIHQGEASGNVLSQSPGTIQLQELPLSVPPAAMRPLNQRDAAKVYQKMIKKGGTWQKLREEGLTIETLSRNNIENLERRLNSLTPAEKRFYDAAVGQKYHVTHFTSVDLSSPDRNDVTLYSRAKLQDMK